VLTAETGYTITVSEWVNDSSLVEGSIRNRKRCIRYLEQANHCNVRDLVEDIKAGKISVYSVCKRFVDTLRKENRAPLTVYVYRSQLPGLFQSVLGEANFSRTVFDRLVPNAPVYVSTIKKIPNPEQVRTMLKIASPQYRAIIGGFACTGMRIGEWVARKMSDLEIRTDGHARVTLRASETKGRYRRYAFLTKETVEWVKIQQTNPSEYVFPGVNGGHLTTHAVQQQMKVIYRNAGMTDSEKEIYCAHSFRTFADSEMSKAGLDRKYVAAIVGHKSQLSAEASYLDWNVIEQEWVSKCHDKMCFLDTGADAQKQVVELTRQNGKLEALLEKLLERLT